MKEILYIPDEHLEEVIEVIRAGLNKLKVSKSCKKNLLEWCQETEDYWRSIETKNDK